VQALYTSQSWLGSKKSSFKVLVLGLDTWYKCAARDHPD